MDVFSEQIWQFAVTGLIAGCVVAVAVYLAMRRTGGHRQALSQAEEARRNAENRSASLDEAVRRLEADLAAQGQRSDALAARLDEARDALAVREREMATLVERREREAEAATQRIQELTNAREAMTKEFRLLAEEVMSKHSQTFKQQNREQLDGLLNPLRQKIVEFQIGMTDAQKQAAEGRARLAEQIRHLSEHSTRMTEETVNLTRALKGDSQVRGAWGEMVLTRILEISGLRQGEEFTTQESETLDDGSRLRPDAIVNLPGDRRLVIDSKVSLVAYEKYANADSEAERMACLRDHVTAMKTHIRQLSGKDYTRLSGLTPDYVIMFVPIEGAFAAALEAEPDLTATALHQNITLAAPTTLITILRSVSHLWQVDRQQKNAEEIASRAGLLYDKFEGFVGDMARVRKGIDDAAQAHDKAMNKLSTGRGNLVSQAESLRLLGAKTKKALPTDLVEDAGVPMIETADD
ncbi:DNA recombination protein RmuC [Minwuia sp.]|uniref:DNA recombination protein RmuC n=1 Tax=Minwuia sp. TaxID=2493630 RepID=UPI003A92F71B